MRIYAAGHRRIEENMRQLKQAADEMLRGKHEGVEFSVRTTGVRVNGNPIHHEPAVIEAFTEILRVRGIRVMIIRQGIAESELNLLADVLSQDAKALRSNGGTSAKLAEELHPHFNLHAAATTFGRGDEPAGSEMTPAVTAEVEEAAQQHFAAVLGEQDAEFADADSTPDPDQQPESTPEPTEEIRLEYTAVDAQQLGADSIELVAQAQKTLLGQASRHDVDRTAAMALTDLVGRSGDELEYRVRRDLLCNVVKERRLEVGALRLAQLHLASDVPDWPYESSAGLLLELGAIAADVELLDGAMGKSNMDKTEARRIAELLAMRPDAFALLTVLLRASLPENIRVPIEDVLVARVKRDRREFRQWAVDNPQRFLNRSCFKFLLDRVDFALGPVVKDLLHSEGDKDRDRVIEMLVENGSEKALRLLAMGMQYTDEQRDTRLIMAFGRFKHPLAVAMLREIVHRCNTANVADEELSSAVTALAKTGTEEALQFLEEITSKRVGFLPLYRRPIRVRAQEAILVA